MTAAMAILLLFTVVNASAGSQAYLDTLVSGGTLTGGPFQFSDFVYLPSGNAPDAGNISVTALDKGLLFQSPLLSTGSPPIDFNIEYTVSAPCEITGAHLSSTGFAEGEGFAIVIENINDGPTLQAGLGNFFSIGGSSNHDSATFDGPDSVRVRSDIGLSGPTAGLSDWTQTFEAECSPVIPTPTAGLAGFGLLGLLAIRRRRAA